MNKILKLAGISIFIIFVLLLRFWNYEGRTTYGWDQSRDIAVLEKYSENHKLPLLGPIVRGDIGGFYLGPIYHYLLIPIYELSNHNPLSLVWLSLALDAGVAISLALLVSPIAGVIWGVSTTLINSSLTPWNVSLVHPWILLIIYMQANIKKSPSKRSLAIFFFVLALSSSIHLTLLPIAFMFGSFSIPVLVKLKSRLQDYLLYLAALILPQIPLILYDLKYNGINIRAFKDFIFVHTHSSQVNILQFMVVFINKLGYSVARLFTGEPFLIAGIIITIVLIAYSIRYRKDNLWIFSSLAIIVVTALSLLVYRDPDFAEYYFNAALIPFVVIAALALEKIRKPILSIAIILMIIFYNFRSLDLRSGPFSMGIKNDLISSAIPYINDGVELQLQIPDHKQFGFDYYLKKSGVSNNPKNTTKVIIAGSEVEHISAPPDAQSIIFQNRLAGFRLVVFTN